MAGRFSKGWHGLTCLSSAVALVLQFTAAPPRPIGTVLRLSQLAEYFTIDSLLLVTLSTALLALGMAEDRPGVRALRWVAVSSMCVTTVVYTTMVHTGSSDWTWHGLARHVFPHYLIPLLVVGGWLVLGPRGWVSGRSIRWSIGWPACWAGLVVLRGLFTEYYPYPFMDPGIVGAHHAVANLAIVLCIVLCTALGGALLDGLGSGWPTARWPVRLDGGGYRVSAVLLDPAEDGDQDRK